MLVLAVALLIDRALGEPPAALHPVVALGRLAAGLERRAPAGPPPRQLAAGVALTTTVVAVAVAAGLLAELLTARLPVIPRLLARALLLKPAFAGRALLEAGEAVRVALADGNLPLARSGLRSLVGRDVAALDAPLLAAAAVESLAENAADSVVAPWLAFLGFGLPAAYGYRAANTLDAMLGYRGRYELLGKVSARLDDALNLLPARLTAALIVAAAALGGGDAGRALAVLRRDHALTASPNAGWPMAAMAGALGVCLEKVGHYCLGAEGRPARPEDIAAAGRLAVRPAEWLVLGLAAWQALGRAHGARRPIPW